MAFSPQPHLPKLSGGGSRLVSLCSSSTTSQSSETEVMEVEEEPAPLLPEKNQLPHSRYYSDTWMRTRRIQPSSILPMYSTISWPRNA
uniref:Uncharacterized protein n=1 Tax=Ditylenchus dipsaci TaxID=166011 RepID=A0A915ET04_9BILA